jgi:hypothetical protein
VIVTQRQQSMERLQVHATACFIPRRGSKYFVHVNDLNALLTASTRFARRHVTNKPLIVPSKTRYELELVHYGGEGAARKAYPSRDAWENIRDGHYRQRAALEVIAARVGWENVLSDRSLLPQQLPGATTLVLFGGDNHFTYCANTVAAHNERAITPVHVLGVVADPQRSVGALTRFRVEEFVASYDALLRNELPVLPWTSIAAHIDRGSTQQYVLPAFSELFIGEAQRLEMSRSRIVAPQRFQGIAEKTSGILVTTHAGQGKHSWYGNIDEQLHCVPRATIDYTAPELMVRPLEAPGEPHVLRSGEALIIESYNDRAGIVAPDAHHEYAVAFPMGSRATIRVGTPLPVIMPRA